jgi:hypothetical protein
LGEGRRGCRGDDKKNEAGGSQQATMDGQQELPRGRFAARHMWL